MSNYKINKIVSTYFDILAEEGMPEKYVREFFHDDGWVTVIMITGKAFSKEVKY
jgi:hypothetical protein